MYHKEPTPVRNRIFHVLIAFLVCPLSAMMPRHITTATSTVVSIRGSAFWVNGQPTYAGHRVQGLLLNSRMIQGLFDDENPATIRNWAYPDTHTWDPQRNTNELVAALPSYAQHGLRMITVGLQGGCPRCDSANGQNITTAFTPNGSLKPAWMHRLAQVIGAAAANGIVVDVSLFYYKQDYRLSSQTAVQRAIDNVVDWLDAGRYTNVLLEIANECNIGNFWHYLSSGGEPRAIAQAQWRSRGRLKVSVSYTGGTVPDAAVVRQADFVELHGNGQSPQGIVSMIAAVRAMPAYQAHPKPIVINEDSTNFSNMDAAVSNRASWGYYDQGTNNYVDGFQSPPVNWTINTPTKMAFFNHVLALAARRGPAGTRP